jgi:hypothetical protein
MKLTFFLVLASLTACAPKLVEIRPSPHQDWVSLGRTNDGALEDFIDVSRIQSGVGIRRAWIKKVYAAHTRRGTDANTDKWQSYQLTLMAFNCDERTDRHETLTEYFEDGSKWALPAKYSPSRWELITAGSIVDRELQFICEWKPK